MDFDRFITLCRVFYLEDFWHVHVNTQKCLAADPELAKNLRVMSMANPKLPIRFSSLADDITWMWAGEVRSPFEPAQYNTGKGMLFTDWSGFVYDEDQGLDRCSIDFTNGRYSLFWNPARTSNDKHTRLYSGELNSMFYTWGTSVVPYEGFDYWAKAMNVFKKGDSLRYYPKRIQAWSTNHNSRLAVEGALGRADETKPTYIEDNQIFEHSSITSTGRLTLTRLVASRTYSWAREIVTDQPRNFYRPDGPAVVIVDSIHETILDNQYDIRVGPFHIHKWYRNGKPIPTEQVAAWAGRNGVVLAEGACFDRPAFASDMDTVTFSLSNID